MEAARARAAELEAQMAGGESAGDSDGDDILTEAQLEGRPSASERAAVLLEAGPEWAQGLVQSAQASWRASPVVRGAGQLAGLYLTVALGVAVRRVWQARTSPEAKRQRYIRRNQAVLRELRQYLPERQAELTPAVVHTIKRSSGFTGAEVFRKYLLYALEQRQFDATTVGDLIHLRGACGMDDAETRACILKLTQNTFGKYGMLSTPRAGLTSDGFAQKTSLRGLIGKYLYLAELPALLAPQEGALETQLVWQILETFGATEEDAATLRIEALESSGTTGL